MSKLKKRIFFYQIFASPHIVPLVNQIAAKNVEISLVVEKLITTDRKLLGWSLPKPFFIKPIIFQNYKDKLTSKVFLKDAIHICQGLIFNGFVRIVQKKLRKYNLNQWVLMESININGNLGKLKKLLYIFLFLIWKNRIKGILAIGNNSKNFYSSIGFNKNKIFPFAYFLNDSISNTKSDAYTDPIFKFIFVGQLIKRKNITLLIDALSLLKKKFKLQVIGNGPLNKDLINYAKKILPNKVEWMGDLQMNEIPKKISDSDCLVLPSYFDGWGAVVSEALMVGTPVICSDNCGSSVVVRSSKFGYIFQNNNSQDLYLKLKKMINKGKISRKKRAVLNKWARCLGAKSGADYLIKILLYSSKKNKKKPTPPWKIKR